MLDDLTCQPDKPEHPKQGGFLEPLSIPSRPWESISLDFITNLPKVGEIGAIFSTIDKILRECYFCA